MCVIFIGRPRARGEAEEEEERRGMERRAGGGGDG